MQYKALILDLDGTTVPNGVDALPSPRVIAAIGKAKNHIHISIATGRPLYKARAILTALSLSGPCVFGNGSQVYDPTTDSLIVEHHLQRKRIPSVIAVARRFHLDVGVFNGVADIPFSDDVSLERILGIYMPVISPGIIHDVEEELKNISGISINKMPSWEHGYECIDVTDAHATKLHGIREVIRLLGIRKEEIIGVGDSYNDFPLLMASGLKIAMGNAVPDLKAIADFIAPPVSEDGVAAIIGKFILPGV